MSTDTTGSAGVLTGVLELVKDAKPDAVSASTEAKVRLYASLIGAGIDQALASAGVSSAVPTIVDASGKILTQLDRIFDAVNAEKATTTAAVAPAPALKAGG